MFNINYREFFQDEKGAFSFKRLQTGVYLALYVGLFIINLFTGLMVTDVLLETLVILNIASYTGVVFEGRLKKAGVTSTEISTKEVKEETISKKE